MSRSSSNTCVIIPNQKGWDSNFRKHAQYHIHRMRLGLIPMYLHCTLTNRRIDSSHLRSDIVLLISTTARTPKRPRAATRRHLRLNALHTIKPQILPQKLPYLSESNEGFLAKSTTGPIKGRSRKDGLYGLRKTACQERKMALKVFSTKRAVSLGFLHFPVHYLFPPLPGRGSRWGSERNAIHINRIDSRPPS